ncbi:MAG: M48 family metalloprotease, partial [Cyanobacteria bacterium P01_F01_bin.143]
KYLSLLARKQLFLVFLTFLLVLFDNSAVISKSVISTEQTRQDQLHSEETYQVSQNFLDINFGGNYYPKLAEADRFYKQGNLVKAREIQRQVKPDFPPTSQPPIPLAGEEELSPVAKEYWLAANQALAQEPDEKKIIKKEILNPLQNLVDESPQFVPGHILLADTYFNLLSKEKKGLSVIEKASELYPDREDVLDKRIEFLLSEGKPLEASIAAREFAYTYPGNPKSSDYTKAADQYYEQYQDKLQARLGITTVVGAGGQVATGNQNAALSLGEILLTGESNAGQLISDSYKSQLKMVSNQDQLQYVNNIGQELAKLMGRDEFTYEFNIVVDPTPNAFALPGGKIFIHTGMLNIIDSEAELAGVLSHEIAHSVLSHGYKKIADSALTNTGVGILSNLLGSNTGTSLLQVGEILLNQKFSRDKEKQADILGLRVLAAADYSADGLYNIMAKLEQLEDSSNFAQSLLSSHPDSENRMRYIEELIQNKGYNRHAFEGVEEYQATFPGYS